MLNLEHFTAIQDASAWTTFTSSGETARQTTAFVCTQGCKDTDIQCNENSIRIPGADRFHSKLMLLLFMQNMWQLNSEEINRPGNFSTHARRNLDLLLKVLSNGNDANYLLFLAQHLKNKPDAPRHYLRDNERQAMFKKVYLGVMNTSDS